MSSDQIFGGVLQYSVLLFSLVFHEFGHAWTALRCGDPTAKSLGRVTLNPMAHADPVGTVLFPMMQIFAHVPLIGWAKPVPFNPDNLGNPRRDSILISAAGPIFNLILALIAAFAWRMSHALLGTTTDGSMGHTIGIFLSTLLPLFLQINLLLALFNLIPVPPLDGSWILYHLLPPRLAEPFRSFGAQWGFVLILALVFTGVARNFLALGYAFVAPVFRVVAGI